MSDMITCPNCQLKLKTPAYAAGPGDTVTMTCPNCGEKWSRQVPAPKSETPEHCPRCTVLLSEPLETHWKRHHVGPTPDKPTDSSKDEDPFAGTLEQTKADIAAKYDFIDGSYTPTQPQAGGQTYEAGWQVGYACAIAQYAYGYEVMKPSEAIAKHEAEATRRVEEALREARIKRHACTACFALLSLSEVHDCPEIKAREQAAVRAAINALEQAFKDTPEYRNTGYGAVKSAFDRVVISAIEQKGQPNGK